MNINVIIVIAAYALELIEVIWFFIRLKKYGIQDKSVFTRDFIVKLVIIYLCILIIPALCIFINFGLVGDIVLCGCAVLGLEAVNRDFIAKDE